MILHRCGGQRRKKQGLWQHSDFLTKKLAWKMWSFQDILIRSFWNNFTQSAHFSICPVFHVSYDLVLLPTALLKVVQPCATSTGIHGTVFQMPCQIISSNWKNSTALIALIVRLPSMLRNLGQLGISSWFSGFFLQWGFASSPLFHLRWRVC